MKELHQYLNYLTHLQGEVMLRDTACMIIKFQLNGSNKHLLKFFEKNRLSGTCLYIILIIIKYVTINELMI